MGTARYIETVNNQVAIYTTAFSLVSQASTRVLGNTTDSYLGDPQIVWDTTTKKFYYAMFDELSDGTYRLDIGYSRGPKPTSAATSFCHYYFRNASDPTALPDYPKIGGINSYLLIGVNYYGLGAPYSAVAWLKKPGAARVRSCPAAPATGMKTGMPFTPVPARQIDQPKTGYVLSSVPYGGSALTEIPVTATAAGPSFGKPRSISVPAYRVPANAEQPNGRYLDTLDTRLWQVQQAYDPRLRRMELWTSLTTYAGAGSGVEWFEINPAGSVDQTGIISDPTLYVFNGSISSDRAYTSRRLKAFGSNMVVGFDTSSASENPAIQMVSKRGAAATSDMVLVVRSAAPDQDFTCPDVGDTCRWGDYSSASPNPDASTTAGTGSVYLTSMYSGGAHWLTRNWVATP